MGPSGPTPKDQLPVTVAEMAIPVSVQEFSQQNGTNNVDRKELGSSHITRTTNMQRAASFNTGRSRNCGNEVVVKRRLSLSSEDKKVFTLPPKPSAAFRKNNFIDSLFLT
jgi:hypothetical protein